MELSSSADNFLNNRVFHELFSDLFEASVRLLTPITQENSELALLYVRVRMNSLFGCSFVRVSIVFPNNGYSNNGKSVYFILVTNEERNCKKKKCWQKKKTFSLVNLNFSNK